jgi:hypothetical protein
MLVNQFDRLFCTDPRATQEFRAILKQIATFKGGSQRRGVWTLKDEFKDRLPESTISRASSVATQGDG